MLEIFNADRRSMTFPEQSALFSAAEDRLRLKPLPGVRRRLERVRAPLLVLKPLVESQNVPALLDALDNCHAIWTTGERRCVRPRLLRSAEWRAKPPPTPYERAPTGGARCFRKPLAPFWPGVTSCYQPGMDPYNAATHFWWTRTSLYSDLRLDKRPEVHLCSHERFVASPEQTMRGLYDFIGVRYPDLDVTQAVHRQSARRGADVTLSPEIQQICEELWQRLQRIELGTEHPPV